MTLNVNFIAGPGVGKSTTAASIFSQIKRVYAGKITCELVTEVAKDFVWDGMPVPFDPFSIWASQRRKIQRLQDIVDIVICDGPPILCPAYARYEDSMSATLLPQFEELVIADHNERVNFNVWVSRKKPFSQVGRHVNEKQARELDGIIASFLIRAQISTENFDIEDSEIDLLNSIIERYRP